MITPSVPFSRLTIFLFTPCPVDITVNGCFPTPTTRKNSLKVRPGLKKERNNFPNKPFFISSLPTEDDDFSKMSKNQFVFDTSKVTKSFAQKKLNLNFCTGTRIRTQIKGFGDPYSTIELYPCIRKGEDGSVDDSFYDRHYFSLYLQTPIIATGINSRVIAIIIPRLTLVGREGFEPPYSEESRFTVCRL